MHIEWNITKRRGNIRPVLHYTVTLEEHERELALPFIRVVSTIPEPPDSWQEFCYPGQHERAENPASGKTYDLEIPSHKGRLWKQSLRLPWREENDYPEVEQSFKKLRDAFEAELKAAYGSLPMDESNSLETSFDARRFIAPGILAGSIRKASCSYSIRRTWLLLRVKVWPRWAGAVSVTRLRSGRFRTRSVRRTRHLRWRRKAS